MSHQKIAAHLHPLIALGWQVFDDRLLPGTDHRLDHLVVGPRGVVVLTPLPVALALTVQTPDSDAAHREQLGPWLATRRWEAAQLRLILADVLPPDDIGEHDHKVSRVAACVVDVDVHRSLGTFLEQPLTDIWVVPVSALDILRDLLSQPDLDERPVQSIAKMIDCRLRPPAAGEPPSPGRSVSEP